MWVRGQNACLACARAKLNLLFPPNPPSATQNNCAGIFLRSKCLEGRDKKITPVLEAVLESEGGWGRVVSSCL